MRFRFVVSQSRAWIFGLMMIQAAGMMAFSWPEWGKKKAEEPRQEDSNSKRALPQGQGKDAVGQLPEIVPAVQPPYRELLPRQTLVASQIPKNPLEDIPRIPDIPKVSSVPPVAQGVPSLPDIGAVEIQREIQDIIRLNETLRLQSQKQVQEIQKLNELAKIHQQTLAQLQIPKSLPPKLEPIAIPPKEMKGEEEDVRLLKKDLRADQSRAQNSKAGMDSRS